MEVQAAGPPALALRRGMIDRYVDLLCEVADGLVVEHPDEVRPVGRDLLVAAVGGINELMLARVERGEADRLHEDTPVAAAVVIGLLERRGRAPAPRRLVPTCSRQPEYGTAHRARPSPVLRVHNPRSATSANHRS